MTLASFRSVFSTSMQDHPTPTPPPLLWWIIWGVIITGFIAFYGILTSGAGPLVPTPPAVGWLPLVPLAASAVLRFVALPKLRNSRFAFMFFVVSLALAEAGGLLGIFLGGDYRAVLAAAAIVAMILHAPAFLLRSKG